MGGRALERRDGRLSIEQNRIERGSNLGEPLLERGRQEVARPRQFRRGELLREEPSASARSRVAPATSPLAIRRRTTPSASLAEASAFAGEMSFSPT